MIIAGTGHRPPKLGGYGFEATQHVIRVAEIALDGHRPDVVISGMALGWDQALAEAAIKLNIELHAYIPFLTQSARWPQVSQDRYLELLDAAKVVKDCSNGGLYSASAMQLRNEAMVDDCDLVLALWDGQPSGGTFNCIQYAEKIGRTIDNCWEDYWK